MRSSKRLTLPNIVSNSEALHWQYHDKCCYCEGKKNENFVLEVEHYRPKKRLTGGKKEDHKGYHWLADEKSNYVLACRKCNGKKGTQFPITGQRVNNATIVDFLTLQTTEKPLLLHPEYDEPEHYFEFSSDGQIKAKAHNAKGKKTIEICDLERLQYDRLKSLQDKIMPAMIESFSNFKRQIIKANFTKEIFANDIFNNRESEFINYFEFTFYDLLNQINQCKVFSLYYCYVVANAEKYLFPHIEEQIKILYGIVSDENQLALDCMKILWRFHAKKHPLTQIAKAITELQPPEN